MLFHPGDIQLSRLLFFLPIPVLDPGFQAREGGRHGIIIGRIKYAPDRSRTHVLHDLVHVVDAFLRVFLRREGKRECLFAVFSPFSHEKIAQQDQSGDRARQLIWGYPGVDDRMVHREPIIRQHTDHKAAAHGQTVEHIDFMKTAGNQLRFDPVCYILHGGKFLVCCEIVPRHCNSKYMKILFQIID